MTRAHAGARRHDSQNSTATAPAASRNARSPRSREQLLRGGAGLCGRRSGRALSAAAGGAHQPGRMVGPMTRAPGRRRRMHAGSRRGAHVGCRCAHAGGERVAHAGSKWCAHAGGEQRAHAGSKAVRAHLKMKLRMVSISTLSSPCSSVALCRSKNSIFCISSVRNSSMRSVASTCRPAAFGGAANRAAWPRAGRPHAVTCLHRGFPSGRQPTAQAVSLLPTYPHTHTQTHTFSPSAIMLIMYALVRSGSST